MSQRTETRENAKNRMEGSLHQFQIDQEVRRLQSEPTYRAGEQNQITLIHGSAHRGGSPLRVALFGFHAGNVLRDHRVSGPITVQVLSGRIRFSTADGDSVEMVPGSLIDLAGGITHSVEALEESAMLLTVVQIGEPASQSEAD